KTITHDQKPKSRHSCRNGFKDSDVVISNSMAHSQPIKTNRPRKMIAQSVFLAASSVITPPATETSLPKFETVRPRYSSEGISYGPSAASNGGVSPCSRHQAFSAARCSASFLFGPHAGGYASVPTTAAILKHFE